MSYMFNKKLNLSFQEAIIKTKEELKKEGFGVLTEIDVKKTLKEKINIDYEDYIILGACNPQFAYMALESEKEVGLLLPCNIIVYVKENKTFVSAIDPLKAMKIAKNNKLQEIAEKVKNKLKKVVNNI